MKKITLIIALLILTLAFSACGNKTEPTDAPVDDVKTDVVDKVDEKEPAGEKEEDKKPVEDEKPVEDKKPAVDEKPVEDKKPVADEKPAEDKKPEEQPQETKPQVDNRSLADIMTELTDNLGEMPMIAQTELDESNFVFYTFADYIYGAEAIVSEPMMGSFAHSVVLVRLPNSADVNTFAAKVRANADPRKWICVEAEKVQVSTKGNLVLLVMSSSDVVDTVTSRFLNN